MKPPGNVFLATNCSSSFSKGFKSGGMSLPKRNMISKVMKDCMAPLEDKGGSIQADDSYSNNGTIDLRYGKESQPNFKTPQRHQMTRTLRHQSRISEPAKLLSTSEYVDQTMLTDTSPSTLKSRLLTIKQAFEGDKECSPLLKVRECTSLSSLLKQKTPDLISKLKSKYKVSQADFKDAVIKYQQSLKELTKSHLIEIKNLKFQTHKPLLYQMIGYLLRMSKNNTQAATAQESSAEEILAVIASDSLKKLMVSIDPFNVVSIPTALSLLQDIETNNQAQLFKDIASGKSHQTTLGAVSSLLKFVYNGCIITLGCRIFGYNGQEELTKQESSIMQRTSIGDNRSSLRKGSQRSSITDSQTLRGSSIDGESKAKLLQHKRSKTMIKQGTFLKPKHLYFSNETQTLQVAPKIPSTIPVFNMHETLPKHVLRDHFDEVELPDIDLYNYEDVSLAKYLPQESPIFQNYKAQPTPKIFQYSDIKEKLDQMPLSNDGILLYSKEEDPENMPTAVLKKLAELMRKRRVEVYETNDVNIKVNKRMFKMM